jgi:hypothetical protein
VEHEAELRFPPRKPFQPSEHLHLIREIPPTPKKGYMINQVFCVGCQKPVFLVHLDLPPEDPKK